MKRALSALLLVPALAACQVRTEVTVEMREDGSGTVEVVVDLDPDALDRIGRLEEELRVDDLEVAGWTVSTTTDGLPDGHAQVRASKPYTTPEDAVAVLAEVGLLRDVTLTRERAFATTSYGFRATVDLSAGLEGFADEALAVALDGEPLGESVAAIEERIGAPIEEAFTLAVAVRLPGGGSLDETPRLGAEPVVLAVESDVGRPRTVALVALAAVAAVGALVALSGFPWRRRARRGKHAAPT